MEVAKKHQPQEVPKSRITQEAYQRQRAIKWAEKHGVTSAALRYYISRKTVYKWIKRYDGTVESLVDQPRTTHHCPRKQTEQELQLVDFHFYCWV